MKLLPRTLTAGPWALRGYQVRANNGQGMHVATYQTSEADGRCLAASRELLDLLLMGAEERYESPQVFKELVLRRLVELKLLVPCRVCGDNPDADDCSGCGGKAGPIPTGSLR